MARRADVDWQVVVARLRGATPAEISDHLRIPLCEVRAIITRYERSRGGTDVACDAGGRAGRMKDSQ